MGEREPQIILWPRSKPGKSVAQVNACHWPESLNSQYSFTGRHLVTPKHTALSEEASLPNACSSMRAHTHTDGDRYSSTISMCLLRAQSTTSIHPFRFRRYHTNHWRRLRLPEFSLMGTCIFISSRALSDFWSVNWTPTPYCFCEFQTGSWWWSFICGKGVGTDCFFVQQLEEAASGKSNDG